MEALAFMGEMMRKIAIIPNINKDNDLINTHKLVHTLADMGVQPVLPEGTNPTFEDAVYKPKEAVTDGVEMIIVLGGDGTLLTAARENAEKDVPILGLNLGRLGFLAELEREQLDVLSMVIAGNYDISNRMMLDISHADKNFIALNDAVISRGSFSRIIKISVFLDDKFVNSYTADGLIISTPTGSTAYSLSAGGPIVEPSMDLMVITPICPHELNSRSIIVPAERSVSIVVDTPELHDATLTIDGQLCCNIKDDNHIMIKKSPHTTKLIRTQKNSFYETLRKKMET